jgi:hypothetical protein
MSWLSSPKVRLGLIVNGLYFISLFTPATPHTRPRLFAHAREPVVVADSMFVPPAPAPPATVPFAPPSPRSRAAAYESGSLRHVSLDNDLRLVTRPGRALLLAVNFSAPTNPPAVPEFVYFTFHLYTDEQACPYNCQLNIIADSMTLSPEYARSGAAPRTQGLSPGLQGGGAQQPSARPEDDPIFSAQFLDWVGAKISYEEFVKIVMAKQVRIRLGPDWVELSADQMEALRDMQRRIPRPPVEDDSDSY